MNLPLYNICNYVIMYLCTLANMYLNYIYRIVAIGIAGSGIGGGK